MRITRNFVDAQLVAGAQLSLPESNHAHLIRVLRLGVGDRIDLFNGDGHDYPARITQAGKRGCDVEILGRVQVENESRLSIRLLQCIARGDKMDLILQKATELGVQSIQPVISERTEVRLDSERAAKRHAHWLGVVRAACEQSGRARIPTLGQALPLAVALAEANPGTGWVLDPAAETGLDALPAPQGDALSLVVGPEGGLSENDLRAAKAAGFAGLRLGPRILRTETAGLAAIAVLQSRFGDLI